MTNKEAIEWIKQICAYLTSGNPIWRNEPIIEACDLAIKALSQPIISQWIPVKMRPMDSEEREYWEDQFGYELDNEDAVMFDCQMPEDGQEILISFRKWISMDKCEIDGGCYGLEGNGDWEDVVAWMPLPEAYRGEEA